MPDFHDNSIVNIVDFDAIMCIFVCQENAHDCSVSLAWKHLTIHNGLILNVLLKFQALLYTKVIKCISIQ